VRGYRIVVCLDRYVRQRRLFLNYWDNGWSGHWSVGWRFLGVQQISDT
jgi:hypothetical protein